MRRRDSETEIASCPVAAPPRRDAARRPGEALRMLLGATLGASLLAGCATIDRVRGTTIVVEDPGLNFIAPYGGGRRAQCYLTGTTEFTQPFVASGRVLVACPAGFAGGFELIEVQRATQVARTRNFTLYSVPATPGSDAANAAAAVAAASTAATASGETGPQPVLLP